MPRSSVDRPLLAAAVAFAATSAYGARVALREDVPGEPFGLGAPGRTATQLALGWGAGISPPWPMPVTALVLGLRRGPGAAVGTACVVLGASFVAGQLVEPVAWGRRPSSRAVMRAVSLNLLSGIGLVLAGRRRVLARR